MRILVKKLDPQAKLPQRATSGSFGYDLFCLEDKWCGPNKTTKVRTGIAIEIPEGYFARVVHRSSAKARVLDIDGTIDSDYRGEVFVAITNHNTFDIEVKAGTSIAQLMIQKVEDAEFEEVWDLSPTLRGVGGFGSTGNTVRSE